MTEQFYKQTAGLLVDDFERLHSWTIAEEEEAPRYEAELESAVRNLPDMTLPQASPNAYAAFIPNSTAMAGSYSGVVTAPDTANPADLELAKAIRNVGSLANARQLAITINSVSRNYSRYPNNNSFQITFSESTTRSPAGTDGCFFAEIPNLTGIVQLELEEISIPYFDLLFRRSQTPRLYLSFTNMDPIRRSLSGRGTTSNFYHTFTITPKNTTVQTLDEHSRPSAIEFVGIPNVVAYPGSEFEIRETTFSIIGEDGTLVRLPPDRVDIINLAPLETTKTLFTTSSPHYLNSGHIVQIFGITDPGPNGPIMLRPEGHTITKLSDTTFSVDTQAGPDASIAGAYFINFSNCVRFSLKAYVSI
jgi:hypothetical protein